MKEGKRKSKQKKNIVVVEPSIKWMAPCGTHIKVTNKHREERRKEGETPPAGPVHAALLETIHDFQGNPSHAFVACLLSP